MQQPIILLAADKNTSLSTFSSVLRTIFAYDVISLGIKESIASAAITPIELAIIDMAAGPDARQLIQKLKATHPSIPVVAIVGYGDVDTIEEVIALGADDFLSQPVPLERLRTTLKTMLRLGKLQKTNTPSAANDIMFKKSCGNLKSLYELEKEAISNAITHCEGCITQAAKKLRIGRSTLYRKIQEMDLENDYISRANQTTRPISVTSVMERS
jgi:DNA-binding NtrC family response regulator